VCKFFLDQSIGATLNTLAFSVAMAAFRGEDWPSAVRIAKADFWPLMNAGWKLWPIVSMFNFMFVKSVQMRSLMGNLAGVGWNVYLSLATPRKGEKWSDSNMAAKSLNGFGAGPADTVGSA
jgi:protein Mpv17